MLETFTILTTEPNAVVEGYHDRMPVMLEAEMEGWLENKSEISQVQWGFGCGAVVARVWQPSGGQQQGVLFSQNRRVNLRVPLETCTLAKVKI